MSEEVPNREGFVTGALAKLPPCPPFPEFTDFERKALDSIAALFEADEAAFRQQVSVARVVDRINTTVGFYTRVEVERSVCRPLPMRMKGGHFEVEGVKHGMGVLLWDDEGYLHQIEGYTYDNELDGVALDQLQFVRSEKQS